MQVQVIVTLILQHVKFLTQLLLLLIPSFFFAILLSTNHVGQLLKLFKIHFTFINLLIELKALKLFHFRIGSNLDGPFLILHLSHLHFPSNDHSILWFHFQIKLVSLVIILTIERLILIAHLWVCFFLLIQP